MKFEIRTEADREAFIAYAKKVKLGKSVYEGEIKRYVKPRSISQNKLLWFWHTLVEVDIGTEKADMHEFVKDRFLPKRTVVLFGEKKEVPWSTTRMNQKQFSWLLEKYHAFMSENDFNLPWPDEQGFEQLYKKYKDWI